MSESPGELMVSESQADLSAIPISDVGAGAPAKENEQAMTSWPPVFPRSVTKRQLLIFLGLTLLLRSGPSGFVYWASETSREVKEILYGAHYVGQIQWGPCEGDNEESRAQCGHIMFV